MKRILLLLAIFAGAIALLALPTPPPSGKITLSWDYAAPVSTDMVFKIYHSTNLATPMTNWGLMATLPSTNRAFSLIVVPGVNFFAMTASNFWGESPFSETVSTPPLPVAAPISITRTN